MVSSRRSDVGDIRNKRLIDPFAMIREALVESENGRREGIVSDSTYILPM